MSLPSCLSDKNLVKFQISACPSLQRLLDAIQLGEAGGGGGGGWWGMARRRLQPKPTAAPAAPARPVIWIQRPCTPMVPHLMPQPDACAPPPPCSLPPPPHAPGNTNPPVTCELTCVQQFGLLSEKCAADLRDAFEADTTATGALASKFFQTCEELMAPVPAPAPAPAMAEIALVEPAPEPAENAEPLRARPAGSGGRCPAGRLGCRPACRRERRQRCCPALAADWPGATVCCASYSCTHPHSLPPTSLRRSPQAPGHRAPGQRQRGAQGAGVPAGAGCRGRPAARVMRRSVPLA